MPRLPPPAPAAGSRACTVARSNHWYSCAARTGSVTEEGADSGFRKGTTGCTIRPANLPMHAATMGSSGGYTPSTQPDAVNIAAALTLPNAHRAGAHRGTLHDRRRACDRGILVHRAQRRRALEPDARRGAGNVDDRVHDAADAREAGIPHDARTIFDLQPAGAGRQLAGPPQDERVSACRPERWRPASEDGSARRGPWRVDAAWMVPSAVAQSCATQARTCRRRAQRSNQYNFA